MRKQQKKRAKRIKFDENKNVRKVVGMLQQQKHRRQRQKKTDDTAITSKLQISSVLGVCAGKYAKRLFICLVFDALTISCDFQ